MCGIVGIKSYHQPITEQQLCSMRDVFQYRGPDDSGVWVDTKSTWIGLAHRRLSIIDPTPSGHQPMQDATNRLTIVFNGEIYNYIELRKDLISRSHQFTTNTDTEVILKAYLEYGYGCLSHFNGMFAIAIWDASRQELFLARDRLGIKPLYYLNDPQEGFIFASESKAILRGLGRKLYLHDGLIDQYMGFGYIPGQDTLHAGIKRLMPGHYAVLKNDTLSIKQYWNLSFNQNEDKGLDYYVKTSKSLLNSAIDLRLRSDVPLGIFLSGGIDSSAVVGLLSERISEPLKTFSVAYDFGKNFNETKYARLVSRKFKTDHNEIFIKPDQFRDFIPDYIRLMDEPVTEAAAISLYFVSKLASDYVTVVLSGEGSDEIFGGYDLYRYMMIIEKYRSVIGSKLSYHIANIASRMPFDNKITKYLTMAGIPLNQRYKGISTYENRYKELLYRAEYKEKLQKKDITDSEIFLDGLFSKMQGKDALSQMLYFDTKTWLTDDLLIKADRMSMAASLELRVPFLDYRLVEFASSIPSKYKINKGQGKYLLKKMLEGLLPEEIIYRKKMGFPTPLKVMFQTNMKDYAIDLLLASNAKTHAYFKKNQIETLLKQHIEGKIDHHRILWQLIVLEEWLKQNY